PGLADAQRSIVYNRRPSGFDGWKAVTSEVETLQVESPRTSTQWVEWLRGVVDRWNVSEGKTEEPDSEAEGRRKFFEALQELLSEHRDRAVSGAEFAQTVGDVLANIKVPLHSEDGGIKVMLPNEIVGCEFQRVFVIGMAEGILPAASIESNV